MTRCLAILLMCLGLLLVSCHNKEREQQLAQREEVLLEKEKQFALKETDYKALIKLRDSLIASRDTMVMIASWPATIAGQWNGKLVCTESTCTDYVVGDQRANIWEFSSDSTHMVAKIINDNQLIRVYTATYANNQIELNFKTDSATSKPVEMKVILNDITPTKMTGTRTLTVDNACTAKFSVELSRILTKE